MENQFFFVVFAFALVVFMVLKDALSRRNEDHEDTTGIASKIHAIKFKGGIAYLFEGWAGHNDVVRRVICFDKKHSALGSSRCALGLLPIWKDEAGYHAMLSQLAELGFAMARSAVDPYEVAAQPVFEEFMPNIARDDEKLSWHGVLNLSGFDNYKKDANGNDVYAFRCRVGQAKVWGYDLIRALSESGAEKGDFVQVMLTGRLKKQMYGTLTNVNQYSIRIIKKGVHAHELSNVAETAAAAA